MTTTSTLQHVHHKATHRLQLPVVAGWAFATAWVVGVIAFPAAPAVDAAAGEVSDFYAAHPAATAVQSLLIHGFAPLALAAVFLALPVPGTARRVLRAAGSVGVGLSLLQLALGLWRSAVAGTASPSTVDALVDAVNRIDGVKMLAFALMIAASAAALRHHRRFTPLAVAASVSLVASAVGYLLLSPTLGLAAFVSLPLLLAWAVSAGVLSARGR
jgi:hypothetical protein